MKQKILMSLTAVVLLLSTGCVNLKPQPDRTRIFILAGDVAAPTDLSSKPASYVARVELPGYLEGTRIHYRSDGGTLSSIASARWAEAPSEALPQALAMHLQATRRTQVRAYYPSSQPSGEVAAISAKLERFSARADGRVELIAQWQVTQPDGSTESGRYVAPEMHWDGAEPAEYVALLDAALAGLAATIADTL